MAKSVVGGLLVSTPNNEALRPVHRIGGIDVLRGLSILFVVILHIDIRIRFDNTPLASHLSRTAISVIFHSGYYGVIVFFVVSGFLITSLSFRRWDALSKIDLREFYALRFARIVPLLTAILVISSALHIGEVQGS